MSEKEHFLFNEKESKKLIRKARFWSTLKIVVIVMVVTPIILFTLWFGIEKLSHKRGDEVLEEVRLWNLITAPNVHISHLHYDPNWFKGNFKLTTFKILGDQPYIWQPIEGTYNLFGNYLLDFSVYNSIQLKGSESLIETNQFERFNLHTGDQEMLFYHPEIDYDTYRDSLSEMEALNENALLELGLSFDQGYQLEEIEAMMPPEVQVAWWWVDAYTDERINFMKEVQDTVVASSWFINGFYSDRYQPEGSRGVTNFISHLEQLRQKKRFSFGWEIEQIYEAIAGENDQIEEEEISIIGAVVTGTPEQLSALQDQPYIQASTFGVITEQRQLNN
ncbi:anti sigma factor C-terminal domain-containing protein [Halalkalibacter oceani]|uniref:anti sigma factor C-terminal domain-containing protein n=1 Tax=Halalkalibacter oceani TaxID=1653776 RepID=UPI003391D460